MWPETVIQESFDKSKSKVDYKGEDTKGLATKGPAEISDEKTKVILSEELIVFKMNLII